MQERPDPSQLCEALMRFLMGELQPAVAADARLAFRVLIGANLARIVAAELREKPAQRARERAGLAALMPDAPDGELGDLNKELCRRLRERWYDADQLTAVRAHLREVLRADLAISNPRFDLRMDVE